MITYIVTITVAPAFYSDYLNEMKSHHAQAVVDTGCFDAYHIYEIIDGPINTLEIHYQTTQQERLDQYLTVHAPMLRQEVKQMFGDQFQASRRVLRSL